MDPSTKCCGGPDGRLESARLNRDCFCLSLDREALCAALQQEVEDRAFCDTFIHARPHLFSNTPVFLAQEDFAAMLRVARAIEAAARLPGYRAAALARAPEIARRDYAPLGAFMGYDFHLAAAGPRLIEVNSNAGGAFLNAPLARAQRACCPEVTQALNRNEAVAFDAAVMDMFAQEWTLQRGGGMPGRIAIVDDRPAEQYLYPEFLLAERLFRRHGVDAVIADAAELRHEGGRLLAADGAPVDLVYNRLVDFALERPEHAALRAALLADDVVVTPHPGVHALLADKRNLALLTDADALRRWGLAEAAIADLAGIPRTVELGPENADALWTARKTLFFKPAGGHGSKAVYRGDKVTRGVWAEISRGGYVAQDYAAPSERNIQIDGAPATRKMDVRLYTYDGKVLLTAARLYQGQATNLRTPGGGFAPVFVV